MSAASQFADLHHGPDPLVLPNCWDVASALVLAEVGGRPLLVELLDADGAVVRTGAPRTGAVPTTGLDLADLQPGAHVLRLGGADAAGLDRPLHVEVLPVLR